MKELKFIEKDNMVPVESFIEFTSKAPKNIRGKRVAMSAPGFKEENRFDDKISLEKEWFVSKTEPEYKESVLPTVNELLKTGKVRELNLNRSFKITRVLSRKEYTRNGQPDFKAIRKAAKDFGLLVTEMSLMRNYLRWLEKPDDSQWSLLVSEYRQKGKRPRVEVISGANQK